ncbi:MAG: DUF58 domain-containing protein [Candidatus Altiarchaeales archaeon]|nr:DUF58 domain-containing protein [Candidatus Altiarchaeales archaeon]MBD3415885.1 DUF58 domain-containing protein [Candidatus Altiarchaeales archaeon]
MIDPSFLDELKELNFIIRQKVSSVYAGGRPSIKHGKGIEVVDYREYIPGDDFRLIDWRVYGRTEKLYIRRFEEEKNLIIHILVDSSSSMDFKVGGMHKFDYAGSIAAGFGFLAVHNHEKFATGLYSDTIRELTQAKKSRAHLFNVIDLFNRIKLTGGTDLGVCAAQYSKVIKSKSFSIIISDFIEDMESITEGIYRMAKHSKEMLLVQVLDPWELDLGWRDDIKFQDLETGDIKRTFLSPGFRREYAKKIRDHNAQVNEICKDIGVDFITVTTDTPIFDSFVKLVGGGKRGG